MAVTYGFFNSVNGDRKYNAEQMSEYFRGIINEGVYQHLDGGLAVTAGTGLAVNVAAGRAIIQNRWVQNSAAMSLTIAAASETYARKDAVVIRLNWSSRSISIAVKTGTPAASPVAPSMTRNSTTYEMALAYVNVAANATSVTVTDKRSDSTVCGWVTVAQATSGEVDAMLNAMKTGFDGETYSSPVAMVQGCDNKLQNEIENVYDTIISNLAHTSVLSGYWLTTTGAFDPSNSLYSSEKILVTPGDVISVDPTIFTGTFYLLYWKADGTLLSYNTNRLDTVPANAAYAAIDFLASLGLSEVEFTIRTQLTADVLDSKRKVNFIANVIDGSYDYEQLTVNFTSQKLLLANGTVSNFSSADWNVSDLIDVSNYVYLRIVGSSGYSNLIYALYDENETFISGKSTGSTTESFDGVIYLDPLVKYIRTAYVNSILPGAVYNIIGLTERKWEGKKWVCIGDSLTEVNSRTTKHYHDYIAEKTGITVVNMGDSGSGYMNEQNLGTAFYQRAANIPLDADVYTIFGSGNDLSHPLGTPTDSGTTTICGCINETIDVLIGLKPTIQLGIVAPTPWEPYQPDLNDSNAMAQYVKALKEICYIRSIPFLDLYHESNLRPWTAEGRAACFSKDDGHGTHPDEEGHKIIAPRFEGFLDSLLLS